MLFSFMPYKIISLLTLKLKANNVHRQPVSRCFVSDWAELRGDAVGETQQPHSFSPHTGRAGRAAGKQDRTHGTH